MILHNNNNIIIIITIRWYNDILTITDEGELFEQIRLYSKSTNFQTNSLA